MEQTRHESLDGRIPCNRDKSGRVMMKPIDCITSVVIAANLERLFN